VPQRQAVAKCRYGLALDCGCTIEAAEGFWHLKACKQPPVLATHYEKHMTTRKLEEKSRLASLYPATLAPRRSTKRWTILTRIDAIIHQ
jgi:hypothetical protein